MPVVPGTGQALGGDRALLGPRAGLQDVKQREPNRLLELGVAFQLDVRAVPEIVQILALLIGEPVPTAVLGFRQRGDDLIANRGHRARS